VVISSEHPRDCGAGECSSGGMTVGRGKQGDLRQRNCHNVRTTWSTTNLIRNQVGMILRVRGWKLGHSRFCRDTTLNYETDS